MPGNNTTISGLNPNGTISLPSVSPQTPIKSLIDSPFRSSRSVHSSPIRSAPNSSSSVDANKLLKDKIRMHQQKYAERFKNSYSNVNDPVDNDTFLHSVFGNRSRGRSFSNSNFTHDQGMTNLRNIGMSSVNANLNLNTLQEPQETNIRNHSNKISEKEIQKSLPIQDLENEYVFQALKRRVNKELEIKRLLYSILFFLVFKFVKSFIRLFVYTHPIIGKTLNKTSDLITDYTETINNPILAKIVLLIAKCITFDSVLNTSSHIEFYINILIAFIVTSSCYKLLKPKDRCLDLPLTKAQRKMLDLDDNNDGKKVDGSPFDIILNSQGSRNDTELEEEDEEEDELIRRINNPLSSSEVMQPTRVVVPDLSNLEGVMGGLNSLAIRNGRSTNSRGDIGNMTWG